MERCEARLLTRDDDRRWDEDDQAPEESEKGFWGGLQIMVLGVKTLCRRMSALPPIAKI